LAAGKAAGVEAFRAAFFLAFAGLAFMIFFDLETGLAFILFVVRFDFVPIFFFAIQTPH